MKIGMIGAGFIGRALATLAVRSGHEVMISNSRHPRTLGSTAVALGCRVGTSEEAANFGEIVVLAIPFFAYKDIPVAPLRGKVVLDANNYYPKRDGAMPELDENTTTTSELLAQHLTGARVVKAFNAILQGDLLKDALPSGSVHRRALPIAGDDMEAKTIAIALLNDFGYDAVDAGPLSEGWRFQRAMPAYCVPLEAPALRHALAAAQKGIEVAHGSWRK